MKICKLNEKATIPTRGSAEAAGFDLYALVESESGITIYPDETMMIRTGIAVEIPETTFGAIFARSGLATKNGLRPANCVGVVDSDYRGEVMVALHNDSNDPQNITNGMRIAQLVIIPYIAPTIVVADTLSGTERGSNGFGSTGVK